MADDTYTVTRSVSINAPADRIYTQIADFHNWPHWSPWEGLDPAMTRTYSGTESGVGAVYAWSGNRKAGQGRMEIVDAATPIAVTVDLLFEKPFTSHSESVLRIDPESSGSRVTWTMTGRKTFATKVMGLVKSMDKLIGPDFDKGLNRLKSYTEQLTSHRAPTDGPLT